MRTAEYFAALQTVAERHNWKPVHRPILTREFAAEYAYQTGKHVRFDTASLWIRRFIDLGLAKIDRFQQVTVKKEKRTFIKVKYSYGK